MPRLTVHDLPSGSVSRNKRTGKWVADFESRRWGRKRFVATTKVQARAMLDEHRQALVDGLDPSKRTVAQLVDDDLRAYRAARKTKGSVAHREWALGIATGAIGERLVADVTERDVEAVLASKPGLSARSLNAVRKAMVGLFDRAVRDGLILRNPVRAVKPARTTRKRLLLPPREEVVALLDSMLTTNPYGPVLNAIAASGMRTGEARGLRVSDVHEDHITIRGQLGRDGTWADTKTEAGVRNLPIGPRLRAALDAAPESEGYAFTIEGEPVPPMGAYQAWTKAQKAAKADGRWSGPLTTVHGLRHLALSTLVHQPGVSIADAAAIAGHADGGRTVVETYLHRLDEDRERLRKALVEGGLG